MDALLCVTPYYNKTTQSGIVRYYNEIADITDLPLIVYNVPSRTGLNILPQTYKQLSHHQNIVAIKEANPDIVQIEKTMHLCGDDLTVYSGNDDLTLPTLALGGKGVMSVVSNVFPKQMSNICSLFFSGKIQECQRLTLSMFPVFETAFCEVNPIPIKEMLNELGFEVGDCRAPLTKPSESTREKIKSLIKTIKPSPI